MVVEIKDQWALWIWLEWELNIEGIVYGDPRPAWWAAEGDESWW